MSVDLAGAIVDHFGGEPRRATMLANRDGRIVCRVMGVDGDLVVKASTQAGDFAEEARAMRTLSDMGIPVSEAVMVEDGPPALLVSHWIEGEPVSAHCDPEALREVGRILRRIHHVPVEGPFSSHPTVEAWIEHWFGLVMAWWADSERLDAGTGEKTGQWFADVRPLLSDRDGCLMLFDGRPEHILVGPTGRVALIDVADLQAGDAAMDMAVLELDAPGILPSVLDGYEATASEREAFEVLVPFLVFLRALSGAEWQGRVLGDYAESRRYLAKARDALEARAEGR